MMELDLILSIIFCTSYILLQNVSFGTKVRERFKNIPDHHFVFGIPCVGGEEFLTNKFGGLSMGYLTSFAKPINHSTICLDINYFGSPYPNGTYDGIIGLVQSNRINTMIGYIPLNDVPYEPGTFVQAPVSSYNPHIYAAKEPGKSKVGLDVLYLFQNFNNEIWVYFAIISLLFPISFNFLRFKREFKLVFNFKRAFKFRKVTKYFVECWWRTLLLTVGIAAESVSKRTSISIMWTFFVISIYYGYHCIFMNTLSGDLAVNSSDITIDNLKDYLHDDRFSHLTPSTISEKNLIKPLKLYPNGSDEKTLHEIFMKNYNDSSMFQKLGDVRELYTSILEILYQTANRSKVIIEDDVIVECLITNIMCHEIPESIGKISKSKEPIFNTPLAMLVSHSTHPHIVKIFSYRTQIGNEMGLIKGLLTHRFGPALEDAGMNQNLEGFICTEKFRNILKVQTESSWNSLPYAFFSRLFYICISYIAISRIVLSYEIFQKKCDHTRKIRSY